MRTFSASRKAQAKKLNSQSIWLQSLLLQGKSVIYSQNIDSLFLVAYLLGISKTIQTLHILTDRLLLSPYEKQRNSSLYEFTAFEETVNKLVNNKSLSLLFLPASHQTETACPTLMYPLNMFCN